MFTRGRSQASTRTGARLSGPDIAPDYVPTMALRSIDGHLTRTNDTVTAWYRLAPQRWSFRSDSQRVQTILGAAAQFAELQGRWMHLRVTTRPYPIHTWAAAHVRNSIDRPGDVRGAQSFDAYVVGEQEQLLGRAMVDKEVYLGVQVQTRNMLDRAVQTAAPLLRRVFPDAVDAELTAIEHEITHLDNVIGGQGLDGAPVTAEEMQWLIHRSCTIGLPAPGSLPVATGTWETADLATFDDAADYYALPYAPTLTVRGKTGATAGARRHVAVLSVGLMHGLRIPETDEPWMQRTDRLGGAVEWSARVYVRRPEEIEGELQKQMSKVRSQVNHYEIEHDMDAPLTLDRQRNRVREIENEMTSGFTALATRVQAYVRLAVSGETEREALSRAQQLADLYKPKIGLEHPEAQHALLREFIPGEPIATGAYLRRADVKWLASAVPTATAEVGDRRGILIGETATSSRRPVAWDPWMAQELGDRSGLTAVVAGLGAGKSFLGGGIVYKSLRAGATWTILDPSGPLAALCDLPEVQPYARAINLLNARPGILNPYRVVPEPLKEHYLDTDDPTGNWTRECVVAGATRRRLVLDVLTGVLPFEVARMPQTSIVLLHAVRDVGGNADRSPADVIDALRKNQTEHHEHATYIADFLDEMRERMALLIPTDDDDPYAGERDDRLTVLTMAGLTLPRNSNREYWTDAESLGVELLSLAAWLTQRSIYNQPKDRRKGVWIDEAFFLSSVPAGKALMDRFARDSRKWNVRVLLSSQVPADFLKIEGFATLLDSAFVGRLDDVGAQQDALRLLNVPTGVGYEPVIGSLGRRAGAARDSRNREPRQFVFSDGAGGVERIRVDFSGQHLKGLRRALDTTPGEVARLERVTDPVQAIKSAPAGQRLAQALVDPDDELAALSAHTTRTGPNQGIA